VGLEKCGATSFIPTKFIRIFSLGLNEDEAKDKLFEWNERNAIELPLMSLRTWFARHINGDFPIVSVAGMGF
jgi:hypothetical protein